MNHSVESTKKHINVTSSNPPAEPPQSQSLPLSCFSTLIPQLPDRARDVELLDRTLRADSFFRALTPDQKSQLLDWIANDESLVSIQERLASPPPEGFGIDVSITALRRFRVGLWAKERIVGNQEMVDMVFEMQTKADLTQFDRFQMLISHMLHEHAFDLARTYPGHEALTRVISGIQKLAAIDFQRQKLSLERDKLKSQSARYHRVDLNIVPPQPQPQPQPQPPPLKTVAGETL